MSDEKKTLWRRVRHLFGKKTPRRATFSPFRHGYHYPSRALGRDVTITVYLPPSYFSSGRRRYPALLINDGQDLEAVRLEPTLARLYREGRIRELVAAGIHANEERLREYGVAGRPDYRMRGDKAGAHAHFVLRELLPFLERNYRLDGGPYTYAGFSLGGLSAFDVAWKHPERFRRTGVFSGSFWWRSRAFNPDDPDAHRIAHDMVRQGRPRPGLRFWLQTGTDDETSDRNGNGVIDAIDDTLDLIAELERHGYRRGHDITYVEVPGGQHNQHTWGAVMPDFLEWAFGKDSQSR